MDLSKAACALAILVVAAAPATAQTTQTGAPTLVFGIFGGPGHRTTSGTLLSSALPAGAVQPESDRTTATFGFNVGMTVAKRLAVLGAWDQTAGGNTGDGHWGTMTLHAVGRLWVTRRLWVEAGGGASELGFKAPSKASGAITRLWAPGGEASVGADVLKGPRVAVTVSVRYRTATFAQLTVSSVALQIGLFSRR